MMQRAHIWVVALLIGSTLLIGCSTAAHSRSGAGSRGAVSKHPSPALHAKSSKTDQAEREIRSQAHFGTAVFYELNGRHELALEEFLKAAQANPSYEPIVAEAARRLIRAKKPDRAVELLQQSVALPKASGPLHALLGLAYGLAGRTNEAILANRTAIKKQPQTLAAYQNLAQLYLQSGKTNEAVAALDEAARQPSSDAAFLVDLAELFSRYSRLKTLDGEALKVRTRKLLDRASKLKPDDPIVLQKLGDGLFAIEEYAKAEQVFLKLLEEFPDVALIRAKLTDIYLRTGDKAKASEQLEAISREDPTNPRTYSILGALALDQEKFTNAVEYFERAIWLNPEFEQVYYDLAGAHLALHKPDEALSVLGKARSKFKLNFVLEFYTGVAHLAAKKYSEAVKYLTSAEVLAKATEPARLTHGFYYQLGSAHERAGDYEQAEKYLRKCLELSPDNPDAMNYLGYMWADLGKNLEEAKVLIEKAVKKEPANAAFLDSMAWVLYKLKQPQQALEWQLKALEHSKEEDATLYDHLGDIYAALNQWDRAREWWRKSLKVESNEQVRKKLESAPATEHTAR